jgi:hypothetical protein
MSNIVIDLAAEFTGKKAFKQAENASSSLSKSINKLAKGFTAAYVAHKALAFGQASVKAFVADDNAARSLGVTLKNLGLETGNTSIYINDLISRMEKQTGVLDDELRPAMDRLLRATGSITKAQNLLGLALDISAGTGKDLTAVTQALQKSYLGNTASLSKLGVGLSKAELTSSSFADIQKRLTVLFAGQASSAAASYAGQLNKLTIASNNVKEAIGAGIVDALVTLSDDDTLSNLTTNMENLAIYTADVIRGFGLMASALKKIPGISGFDVGMIPILGTYIKVLQDAGAQSRRAAEVAQGKNPIQSGSYLNTTKKVTVLTKEQTAAELKKLAAKKLSLAIDKANLLLGKSTDIFDMDKIQLNAAMINQAQQLGNVTSQSQLLMITNDIARLKIKQDILALEDAIASKDEARITAATNQLNKDILIYNALSNQNLKLADIKSILDSLLPKDLINQSNLDEALRKIKEMLDLLAQMNSGTSGTGGKKTTSGTSGTAKKEPIVIPGAGISLDTSSSSGSAVTDSQKWAEELAAQLVKDAAVKSAVSLTSGLAQSSFSMGVGAGLSTSAAISGARYAAQAAASMGGGYVVNIYANTIANPDELSGLIQDTVIKLNKQGDFLTNAGAL